MSEANPGFVHLSLHTEYSLVDGIIRVEPVKRKTPDDRLQTLAARTAELGFPAIAITDLNNLFVMVKFYKSAESAGIKPVIGAEVLVESDGVPSRVILLAQNSVGYGNIVKLVSSAYTEGKSKLATTVARERFAQWNEGVIVLCGPHSEIGTALLRGQVTEAEQYLAEWRSWFGDRLYLAVQRCRREHDERHTQAAAALSRLHGVPIVATNDVRFLRREDFEVHEARVCINQGRTLSDPRRTQDYSEEQYLKSADEMAGLFSDMPEALANSVEIARRCSVSFTFGVNYLPDFPVDPGETVNEHLSKLTHTGLSRRLAAHGPAEGHDEASYRARLDYELGIIESMGFPGYFLIVADFIQWGKDNGVPVGPGRGSGAGSLVAYSLGITDLDPIPYKLLFERFLNPERVSMPDFDVDFCMEGRDRVIDYVTRKYGRDLVSQIITYGSMAARAVVRDATRVLGHSHGFGDRIAKMIPGIPAYKSEAQDNGCTELEYALQTIPEVQQAYQEDDVKAILDLGLLLEGLARNVGKHAGGVVIAPGPLTDYAPLYKDPESEGVVTQFDMKDLESVGLVKFDFLGLRTLTIIDWAVRMINARRGIGEAPLDIAQLPLDDAPTYELFKRAKTIAVFQFESPGMQRMLKDAKPDRFEDLIALGALYRPGPMDLIPSFVARKHGREPVEYPDPRVEPVLEETYGIMVYQEQVMQMAQIVGGYTLGGADLLRRAMGKKKVEEMVKHRAIFRDGAAKDGLPAEKADEIFDLMERFAGYGFNKSHATAYALVSYQTAWLKTHYPAEFMCAVLSAEMFKTDTIVMMIDECANMGVEIRPPDINRSRFRFTVEDGAVRYGLGAVRGAGEGAIEGIVNEREANGPYTDLLDFCRRIDTRRANKRVLEALINAGALDALGPNRPSLIAQLPRALSYAEQAGSAADVGQVDMFGLDAPSAGPAIELPTLEDCSQRERLAKERDVLGFYLSGHPVETYREMISQIASGTLKELIALCPDTPLPSEEGERPRYRRGPKVVAGAWLVDLRKFGRRGVLTLDDRTAQISVPLSEEQWTRYLERLRKDTLVFVYGRVSPDEYTGGHQIRADEIWDLDQASGRFADRLMITWPRGRAVDVDALEAALRPIRVGSGCGISLQYLNGSAQGMLDFPPAWRVVPTEEGLGALKALVGDEGIQVSYRSAVQADE